MNLTGKKILIVDDHRLFADGLCLVLNQLDPSLSINTEYNARLLLDDLDALNSYDLVLIDLDMPSLSGFDFLMAMRRRETNFKLLVVSGSEEIADVENALRLGAHGFVPKHLPSREILVAIKHVFSGQRFLPRYLAESVNWSVCMSNDDSLNTGNLDVDGLRLRQLEILKLMKDGHSNNKIGVILGISESAVKSHVSNLFKVLQAHNRTSAVKIGIELNLI